MSPAEEKQRAGEARILLDNPLFREACAEIERRLVGELAKADIERDRAEYVRTLLVAHRKIQGYLAQIVQTGDMVIFEEAQRQSWSDRLKMGVFSRAGY